MCHPSQTKIIFDHTISLPGIYPRSDKILRSVLQPFSSWKLMSLLIFLNPSPRKPDLASFGKPEHLHSAPKTEKSGGQQETEKSLNPAEVDPSDKSMLQGHTIGH